MQMSMIMILLGWLGLSDETSGYEGVAAGSYTLCRWLIMIIIVVIITNNTNNNDDNSNSNSNSNSNRTNIVAAGSYTLCRPMTIL